MNKENLCCLIANEGHTGLDLKNIAELPEDLKIDLDNGTWVAADGNKKAVFDWTNFDHFRKALDVTANFHR